MSRSSVISPLLFQVATVQNSTWKLFPVGGITLVGDLHWALHCAVEVCNGACMISFGEQDLVGSIDEVIVRECLEKFYSLQVMVVPSPRWLRLAWPVNGHILCMAFPERVP